MSIPLDKSEALRKKREEKERGEKETLPKDEFLREERGSDLDPPFPHRMRRFPAEKFLRRRF